MTFCISGYTWVWLIIIRMSLQTFLFLVLDCLLPLPSINNATNLFLDWLFLLSTQPGQRWSIRHQILNWNMFCQRNSFWNNTIFCILFSYTYLTISCQNVPFLGLFCGNGTGVEIFLWKKSWNRSWRKFVPKKSQSKFGTEKSLGTGLVTHWWGVVVWISWCHFLAVHNSSIGDLVTHWLTHSLSEWVTHFLNSNLPLRH